jgi:hypothetical protein
LTWARTRAAAVRCQRLTASAMARPHEKLSTWHRKVQLCVLNRKLPYWRLHARHIYEQ